MTHQQEYSDSERIKIASRGLYLPLAEELGRATPKFDHDAEQVLKHHGVYQQDNRDVRAERTGRGLEADYRFMVRVKLPAGRMTAAQYLLCDRLADLYGQGALRVTSRQGLQFHGVHKRDLRPVIHDLNRLADLITLGAAGDVVRNIMAPPVADISPRYGVHGPALRAFSESLSRHFMPETPRYYDIWANDRQATVQEDGTVQFQGDASSTPVLESLYGAAYLPRKFKIALATDFDNSCDVYTNDVGLIAVAQEGVFLGYEVVVGGGMGHLPNRPDRTPDLARPFAFVTPEEAVPLLDAIVQVYRDGGNRSDRHHARLRHLIEVMGMDRFRENVAAAAGRTFPPPRGIVPTGQEDYLGWRPQMQSGLYSLGIWLENGRIRDGEHGARFKTGLRKAVEAFSPEVRFTPHHNLILSHIREEHVEPLNALLREHGIVPHEAIPPLRRWEMACPALPYCPRALSEAERVLPGLLQAIEHEVGADAAIMIRMSGCPNSCSRPRTAEIGLIARNRREYSVYVGGNRAGTRLNAFLVDNVLAEALPGLLCRLIVVWRSGRVRAEPFGDWAHRVGPETLRLETGVEQATPQQGAEQ